MEEIVMKRVRRIFVKMMIAVILLVGNISAKAEVNQFPDVPDTAWYMEDLQYILKDPRGIFSGYPDGTFKPNDTLTVDMYIKLIVTVMGHQVENGKDYWASTYIEKALEEGYIISSEDILIVRKTKDDPYAGYKKPITREDMALITGRALDKIIDESEFRDLLSLTTLIKDYSGIPNRHKIYVTKCYDLGIITGFPDGEFKPDNILSRAEAVAVIRRFIDPTARKRPELPVFANPSPTPIPVEQLDRPQKKELGNGIVEVEGIRFDPSTDIANEYGAMNIMKAEEFVGVALEYLKFYEHDGKARVRGYIPELPEGYELEYAIHIGVIEPDDLGFYGGSYNTLKNEQPARNLGRSGHTFDKSLNTEKENIDVICLTFEIVTLNRSFGGNFYISLTDKKYSRYDRFGKHSYVTTLDPRGFFEW
jgi:hypothetical protein